MSSTRRALAFSFLDRYAGLVLAVVSSMAIARLLTPQEIGVFSVTMVLLSFVSTFRDFGAGQYLVQEKELTTERIRATWTVQLGLGVLFALVGLAAAYPVAAFYGEPRIVGLMAVLSLNFAISPFGSLTYAWLMREMRFDVLALMRFSSSLAGALVSVGLAWKGFGPISLAYGSLLATVVNALIATFFRPAHFPWLPGCAGIRRVMSFGGKVSLTTVLNHCATGAPELLLGKLQSLTAAGFFSRANGLASMFQKLVLDATQGVALAVFAKESRETGDVSGSFVKATAYVTAAAWSFFLVLICLAHPIMRLLYGAQWDASADVARLLAAGMMAGITVAMAPTALMAIGAIDAGVQATLWSVIECIALIAVGAHFGLLGTAAGVAAGTTISTVLWLVITRRHVPFAWRTFAVAMARSAVVALAAGVFPLIALLWFGSDTDRIVAPLAVGVPGAVAMFVVGAFIVRHPIRDDLTALLARLLPRRAGTA